MNHNLSNSFKMIIIKNSDITNTRLNTIRLKLINEIWYIRNSSKPKNHLKVITSNRVNDIKDVE